MLKGRRQRLASVPLPLPLKMMEIDIDSDVTSFFAKKMN